MDVRSLAWLAAASLLPGLPAQDAPPQVPCDQCAGRGEFECKRHGRLLELERAIVRCSEAAACKSCAGALSTDCKICQNPAVQDAAEQRRELARRWLAERRKNVDDLSRGEGIMHLETAHLDLAFSVRPQTVERRKIDTHELMHLYAARIEALRALFCEKFELTDRDFSTRLRVFLFADVMDHKVIGPRMAGGGGSGVSQKLMGAEAVLSAYHDGRTMPGHEGLDRMVVHNVTHLLLANMAPANWLGNRKHGWVDEGVAHWFEDLLTGKCLNFCYEEVALAPGSGFKGGRWRVPIRKLYEAGKLEPFAGVALKNTDQLTWQEHAQAFAYVDFLIAKYGGKAFAEMVRELKRGSETRDALQQAFGLSMLAFDTAFGAWVAATYPLQEKQ
jgi:hypothetical protein